ncbi:MAG: hypothetical protein A2086_04055 [Spirochaetes bacterium GWD1_27_9]|nr:MAG: hypothetical protein A2Z98_09135 [Spirochaetes bacterium GWB1_27_13]OHD24796.1 MAG: hypothetical protein A2Y34_05905 [Spirochaetes bacterium GWC1_27_15]OHD45196.1 MAG: hypothetical protein A2086_04055 [Spirochaetes bacterium GWD1_27_9]
MKKNISSDLNLIRRYFNSDIYQRGKEYYNQSRVSNVVETEDMVTAFVDGSHNNKYLTRISFDTNGDIKNAICSCPYKIFCKHVVATLLYFVSNGAHKVEKPENPLKFIDIIEKKETIIKIKENDGDTNRFSYLKESFEKNIVQKTNKPTKDRWKPIFIIHEEESSYFYGNKEDNFIDFRLGMQYIKKDGNPGRITYDFDEYKITEEITNQVEFELYKKIITKMEQKVKIEVVLDNLIKNDNIPIYIEKQGIIPAKLINIDIIKVNFILEGVSFDKNITYFRSIFSVIDNNQKEYIMDEEFNHYFFNEYILLISKNGNIFYKENFKLLTKFLSEILNFKKQLNSTEIITLKELVNEKFPNKDIIINFNSKLVKTFSGIPTPIIEISTGVSEGTNVNLLFSYQEKEIYFKNKDIQILILPNTNNQEEIITVKRDFYLEDRIFSYLSYKFSSIFQKFIYSMYNKDFDFYLNIPTKKFLVEYGLPLIDEGYEIKFREHKNKLSRNSGRISVFVNSGIDWFDLETQFIDKDGNKLGFKFSKEDILNGLIEIDNKFVILSKEDIEALANLLDEGMDKNGKLKVSKLNFGIIDKLYNNIANKDDSELKAVKDISEKLKNFKKIEKQKLPNKFIGKLRDYQKSGYNWLHFLNKYNINGCLADDMGLGKTVQTLAFLQKLKEDGNLGIVLLVVPVTTIANWENEIEKFSPDLRYNRHFGQQRQKEAELLKDFDIIIVSYHTLRNDIELFNNIEFNYLILDEAQYIKNYNSLMFKSVKLINTKHKLSLTGTPIENNTLELWSQMDFLNHGLLGSLNEFKANFSQKIEAEKDKKAAERLRRTIFPFLLRRKKEDVAKDLPEKEEIVLFCEMEPPQRKVYEELKEYYKMQITEQIDKNGVQKSTIQIFEALLRLRQAALFPSLIDKKYSDIESVKFETMKKMLDEILQEEHKILIFSQFVQSLKIIEEDIKKTKRKYSYIDGSVKHRDKQIKQFQDDKDTNVFLLSLKAGGVGINLTAADYVFLFDPWWNPAVERQAVDRSHRIGQTKKVIVYKFIVKNTVEEKILKLQESKKELVSQLITEEASFFKSLSKSDIINLFN